MTIDHNRRLNQRFCSDWFMFLTVIVILAFKTIIEMTCHSLAKVTCPEIEKHVSFTFYDWTRSIQTNDHLKEFFLPDMQRRNRNQITGKFMRLYRICTFTFETVFGRDGESGVLCETRFLHSRHRGQWPQNCSWRHAKSPSYFVYSEKKVKVIKITSDYVTSNGK